jgi:hypothetical protein
MTGARKKGVGKKTTVVQCIDCKIVIGTEPGTTQKTEVLWSLCTRCVARRNGVIGAKSPHELGIY